MQKDIETPTEKAKEPSFNDIMILFNNFKNYSSYRSSFYSLFAKKQRNPNFPEDISENIVKMLIKKYENRNCIWDTVKGDLFCKSDNKLIEVKCFSSLGPSSFGPTESWDELYFLDAIKYKENYFSCHKIKIPSDSNIWNEVLVNKTQSINDFRSQGKRPRLVFKKLEKFLNNNYPKLIETIFEGYLQ